MQGEPWSGEHRRGIAVCGLLKTTNSAASSKQAHFFRHWRRIACFPCFSIRPAAGGRFAKQIKEAPIKRGHPLGCPLFIGAGGGTRTHTVSPPTDFESVTSTIPSHRQMRNCLFIIIRPGGKCKSLLALSNKFLIFEMNPQEDLWIFCGNSPKLIVEF